MKNEKSVIKKILTALLLIVAVFYISRLMVLHYNQTMYPETGLYESDIYAHIAMALDGWGYSLTAIIIRLFSFLPNEVAFHFAFAVFLGMCEAATLAVTYVFFSKNKISGNIGLFVSLMAAFVMPCYVRCIQECRYIGYQSASIWHNSTYIVMKICALLCICLYLEIAEKYYSEMKYKKVVIFAILLALATAVKTNFILVFAPAALLFLIIDKINGVSWKRVLVSALTVIPSIGVILFQELVLFGKDTGNGIMIDPLYAVYLRAEKPYFTMILSALFPVIVLLYNIVSVIKDTVADLKKKQGVLTHRTFLLAWSMWTVGFAELLLLRETGERALDDNFAWGYDIGLFFVFLISIVYFVKDIVSFKDKKNKAVAIVADSFAGGVLIYHTWCGIVFFVKLCSGATFFMK